MELLGRIPIRPFRPLELERIARYPSSYDKFMIYNTFKIPFKNNLGISNCEARKKSHKAFGY